MQWRRLESRIQLWWRAWKLCRKRWECSNRRTRFLTRLSRNSSKQRRQGMRAKRNLLLWMHNGYSGRITCPRSSRNKENSTRSKGQLVTRLQECKDKAATIKEGLRSAASLLAAEEVEPTMAEPGLFQPPSTFQNFNPVECVQVSDDEFGDMEVTEQKKARLAAEALAAQQSPTKKHKAGEDPDLWSSIHRSP